jgi:hypothetical protein
LTGLDIWTVEKVGSTLTTWADVLVVLIAMTWESSGFIQESSSGTDWAGLDTLFSAGVIQAQGEVITTGLGLRTIGSEFSAGSVWALLELNESLGLTVEGEVTRFALTKLCAV